MPRPSGLARFFLVVAVAVAVVAGVLLVTDRAPGLADCTAEVGDRSVELDTAQAQRATTTAARLLRRTEVPRRAVAPLTRALERSQDRWEAADARVLARALSGRARGAFSCRHAGSPDAEPDRLNRRGLTARAERVRRDLSVAFGDQRYGGFAPGGVSTGHREGSAHYQGRALDVFFRPVGPRNKTRGWAMAHYLVAHATRLEVSTVIFDGRIWTTRRASQGWRDYRPDTRGRSREVARILEHRDHVHVDVAD